ncbi:MAG: thiamine pyrophosphate-requiring protein [Candidatus Tectomicrobia bacterium]
MPRKTVDVETTSQAYLELLRERGVDYFFANGGTDFAPLIDAFARFAEQGKPTPKPITVPHENAAVAMAHGYYMVTGKPQVVMVHVNVGTGNAINGIINASRDQVPILFSAGRTPLTETGLHGSRNIYIHWAQEAFDQAGMIREYVKWDYELRNFTQLESVVDRALEIAMTEPRGPVYLTLPREVLGESHEQLTMTSPARRDLGGRLYPDPQSIEAAASMLAAADNPLIITGTSGRNPETVGHLVALAESFAIPVVEFNRRHLCFPTNHPLHLGFAPDPFLDTADVVLAIDSDVPWFPSVKNPPEDGKVIHMGLDPSYSSYPIRSFPCDLAIRADSSVAVPQLTDALASHRQRAQDRIAARFEHLKAIHEQQRAAWREALEGVRDDSPLDPQWVSHCIDEIKDDDTIIVNEYDLIPTQADFTKPGTIFGNSPAGGLGWGLGASLGAKLAAPDKLVIATLGDGSYMFGNPTPCHFVSQAQGLPTLTVVFNNRVYNAVRRANLGMYPNGWAAKTNNFPLSELEPSPNFEVLVTASGGYGERVENAAEVQPALQRALKAVREEGRQAVLNMICKHP